MRDKSGLPMKGHSGNAGSRPKDGRNIAALARSYSTEAIETLVELMRNARDDKVRGTAAQALLDRGWVHCVHVRGGVCIISRRKMKSRRRLKSNKELSPRQTIKGGNFSWPQLWPTLSLEKVIRAKCSLQNHLA